MKKKILLLGFLLLGLNIYAQEERRDTLSEASVVSFYRNSIDVGSLVKHESLIKENHGQEPSHLFRKMPGVFSMSDNGTEFGYGYFRIRGLDQTRINVTLDGMPWNEAEDYGTYFANSPDLLSSLHSVKVERGSSATNNGTASSGGSINLESIDLLRDTESYGYLGLGSFDTYKTSVIYNSGLHGKSAIHVKGTQQQTSGYRDYGFNNSQALGLKYGYFFNPSHSITLLSLSGRHRNGQGWLGDTMAELEVNPRHNGNIKTEDDEWFQSIGMIQYKGWITDFLFLSSSAYLQYQSGWYNMDLDNYMKRMVDPTWGDTGIRYSYGLEHYLYGGNIAGKLFLGPLTLTAGINAYKYQREHFLDQRLEEHYSGCTPSDWYDNFGYKNDLNAFLGVKYTNGGFTVGWNVQYRYVDFSYRDVLDPTQSFDSSANGTKWNFINYGVNLEYKTRKVGTFYIRYSEVSREPTRTDMFGGNEVYPGELTTNKAERSYDIEGGYVYVSPKIKANINLYCMFFKNERILNGRYGLNGLPLHDTATSSYRTGIEGSLDWNFWGPFWYSLNASLSQNKVESETFHEKNHILTPGITLYNDLSWKAGNFALGINSFYHSKMWLDQGNEHEIPWYLVFGAYGNYKYKSVEFGLRVGNLFNRVNYYNAAIGAGDEILWFREAGRNFFMDVKFYF